MAATKFSFFDISISDRGDFPSITEIALFFFCSFVYLIRWDKIAVCSKHPATFGIPYFWILVSMYLLSSVKFSSLSALITTTFNRDTGMVLYCSFPVVPDYYEYTFCPSARLQTTFI